ncbi:MAG: helix-turn-helix transcriptional regulator [Anaerolineae bacterium]|nr:helix-turn-helix transcriptional regulator [Anaerolineae bacterium]
MLFTLEDKLPQSSFIEAIWLNQSERAGSFISTAAIHWEMVLMQYKGKTTITVRGPETKTSRADFPAGAEWLGITFKLGTFMPNFLPGSLLDRQDVNLPEAADQSFWLGGSAWEFPTYENSETFVNRLVRNELIVRDPLVDDVLRDYPLELSPRALQYRFQRATGLTQKAVQQIQRARQATTLLESGQPILDTAYQLGYFDQSHLTNSLKRYMGQTPAQISRVLQPE